MADQRVPKIKDTEKPTFDAATFSDRLQETRTAPGALTAVAVFDKAKPAAIVNLAQYVKGKLSDTVNALTEFTADHEERLDSQGARISELDTRLAVVEATRPPFGSASG